MTGRTGITRECYSEQDYKCGKTTEDGKDYRGDRKIKGGLESTGRTK